MKKDTISYPYYFEVLRKTAVFSTLSDHVLDEILNMFYVETWSKGQLSFNGDKTLHKFYFVVSGRIKMYQIHPEKGTEHTLYINTPGDLFDVICLLDNKRHEVEMEALDDAVLLSAPTNVVREWILKHPDFNKIFMKYIAKQLRDMEEKANDLVFFDTWTRTLRLFVKHSTQHTNKTELHLINNLTHSEIAKIIGTSKNVINLHIQALKKKGILEVKRHEIKLKNLQELLFLLNGK